jgi:hypothetical protein
VRHRGYPPAVPQMPTFEIEGESISISPRDADRIVDKLREWPNATSAEKIHRATQLHQDTSVRLAIGEDEAVLAALTELRPSGDFHSSLDRLERAIRAKIEREP